jgi:ABC-type dipeptide/oligopeptide/nickel transport system permease subunit
MTSSTPQAASAESVLASDSVLSTQRSVLTLWRFARRKPLGAVSALLLLGVVLMAVFAPLIATHDPAQNIPRARLKAPSSTYLMGTDAQARDMFSRIVYGARLSLKVGILSVALGTLAGAVVGLISGYFSGAVDLVIQRCVDIMLAVPVLILAIALVALLGRSTTNVVLAIAIGLIPGASRVVRGAVLAAREHQYVESARALGAGHGRIMLRHILPNVMAPIIILATVGLGGAIIAETSLSFLGLGPPVTQPSWGEMLSNQARTFMTVAPWLGIFPGLAITITVFSVNMLGDALRDLLDPRLRA